MLAGLTTEFCTETVTLFLLETAVMAMEAALSTCSRSWLDRRLADLAWSLPRAGSATPRHGALTTNFFKDTSQVFVFVALKADF